MQRIRVATTVLPVGPRSSNFLDEHSDIWFALQVTSGFDKEHPKNDIEQLWPWNLVYDEAGSIPISGWLAKHDNSLSKVDIGTAVAVEGKFAATLRGHIMQKLYDGKDSTLGLQLILPAEWAAMEGEERRDRLTKNFPIRQSFLTSLPGSLSETLRATIYVKISRDDILEKSSGNWAGKGGADRLILAPEKLRRDGHEYSANAAPAPDRNHPGLFFQSFDGDLDVIGPGYQLDRMRTEVGAPGANSLFDLSSFWMPVATGDSRYWDLEGFLFGVADPMTEAAQLSVGMLRDLIKTENNARPLSDDELKFAQQVWRLQELASLLDGAKDGALHSCVKRSLEHLGEPDLDRDEIHRLIPDRLKPSITGNVRDDVRVLALALDVAGGTDRQSLSSLARLSDKNTVAHWLVRAVSAVVMALRSKSLQDAWDFGEDASKRNERRATFANVIVEDVLTAHWVVPHLEKLQNVKKDVDVVDHLRGDESNLGAIGNALVKNWSQRLNSKVAGAFKEFDVSWDIGNALEFADDQLNFLVNTYIQERWPVLGFEEQTDGIGRPMSLVFGNTAHRLVHQDNVDLTGTVNGGTGGVFNELTGHILFVRRHSVKDNLGSAQWRLVSGGVARVGRVEHEIFDPTDGAGDWLEELLPIPEENVFSEGVLRADRGYDGQLRHIQIPMQIAYGLKADDDGIPAAISYQGLGQYAGNNPHVVAAKRLLLAPPLRFGDYYQFAAGLMDAAGGIPSELADDDAPWKLDLNKLEIAAPAEASSPIPYMRRTAVGPINIEPYDRSKGWPRIPSSLRLRCREWSGAQDKENEGVGEGPFKKNDPVVLLADGMHFKEEFRRPSYSFFFSPPTTDEFTLRRWTAPPTTATENEKLACRERLKAALENILVSRGTEHAPGGSVDPRMSVHDPAVEAFGIEVKFFDETGALRQISPPSSYRFIAIDRTTLPYKQKRVEVAVSAGEYQSEPKQDFSSNTLKLTLPAGMFASIEIWPLIEQSSFTDRFEDAVYFGGLLDHSTSFPGYVAFGSNIVLCETAVNQNILPDASSLYEALHLQHAGSDVSVGFKADRAHPAYNFVDRFTVQSERWIWRNRPVIDVKTIPDPGIDDPERKRLLASGAPKALFDAKTRDTSQLVEAWEALASLDRGFVARNDFSARWPRITGSSSQSAAGNALDFQMLLDKRDGASAADYLRYRLVVKSRYEAIYQNPQIVHAKGSEPMQAYRRIFVPFTGGDLDPPKVLSIISLTHSLEASPVKDPPPSPPFMLILHGIAFRNVGNGERIEVELVLEDKDIGEPDNNPRPYRTGPLPDHWLPRPSRGAGNNPYFRRELLDETKGCPRTTLEVFGPFGFTFDSSSDEALAHASCYLIYPPRDVGPHWASFVRIRRAFSIPGHSSDELTSDWSGTYPLYTLPDSRRLVSTGSHDTGWLSFRSEGDNFNGTGHGLTFDFDPLSGAWVREDDAEAKEQLAQSRGKVAEVYCYFLLVSRLVEAAGQTERVEVPAQVMRLSQLGTNEFKATPLLDQAQLTPLKDCQSARVLEVLLNGKYSGTSRLEKLNTNRAFWESIVGNPDAGRWEDEQDSAGMIRRVSNCFPISWD